MNKETLQRYLNEQIPLSRAMGIEVLEAGLKNVTIRAPLAPNINHMKTAFGGSVSAVAMLSAWSLLYVRLINEDIKSRIVIHKTSATFEQPIVDIFTSVTVFDDEPAWEEFVSKLKTKNKAGLDLSSTLICGEAVAGRLEGHFVSYF